MGYGKEDLDFEREQHSITRATLTKSLDLLGKARDQIASVHRDYTKEEIDLLEEIDSFLITSSS